MAFLPSLGPEADRDFVPPSCTPTKGTTTLGADALAEIVASRLASRGEGLNPRIALADIVGWLNVPMLGAIGSAGFGFAMSGEPIFIWPSLTLLALSSVGTLLRGFVRCSKCTRGAHQAIRRETWGAPLQRETQKGSPGGHA